MKRLAAVLLALTALLASAVQAPPAESETSTGTAARTGTYNRPLLVVDGKRYELKASSKADASVAELLARFSAGDTGAYAIIGTRDTVNGNDCRPPHWRIYRDRQGLGLSVTRYHHLREGAGSIL